VRGEGGRAGRLLVAGGLALADLLDRLHREGLGALDGEAEGAVPEELGQHAEGARHAEEHRVVGVLGEAVVHEQHAGVRVHVGEGVLRLAVLGEHVGHHLVHGGHDLEEGVLGQVLEAELALRGVARVGLAQHGVAVPGDDLAGVEGVPRELADGVVRDGQALLGELVLQVHHPAQHLLVGEAVQRAREAAHGRGEGQIGVGERGAHQASGVRGHIAALVVGVDGEVQAHDLVELGGREAQHAGKVGGVVQARVVVRRRLAAVEGVAVDEGGDLGQARHQVHHVLVGRLPVLGLVHACRRGGGGRRGAEQGGTADRVITTRAHLKVQISAPPRHSSLRLCCSSDSGSRGSARTRVVGLGELGVSLHGEHRRGELRHGVHALGQGADQRLHVRGQLGALVQLLRHGLGLLGGGHLAGQQQPEQALGDGLALGLRGGQHLLQLGDGVPAEADALHEERPQDVSDGWAGGVGR